MKVEEGRAVKKWECKHSGCKKPIEKGQAYFLWHISPGYMARRQHVEHGEPAQPTPKTTKKVTRKKVAKKTAKKRLGTKTKKGAK